MSELYPERFQAWLGSVWPGADPNSIRSAPIEPDGSSRIFLRLRGDGQRLVALINPRNQPENLAWSYIRNHLDAIGIPVGRLYASDLESGFFLMEDMGPELLHDKVLAANRDPGAIERLYLPVLGMLARLQARGARSFDFSVCFDGPELDPAFLRARELDYFETRFVLEGCGLKALPPGYADQAGRLALLAGRAEPRGLVHRDFQSRNIVWGPGGPGLVDFQGARLGPAQYDLASLLHDPYVDLDWDLRLSLKQSYLELRRAEGTFDLKRFEEGWAFISASRVMQALGAYAYLSRVKGKAKFALYASPALNTLRRLFSQPPLSGFDALRSLLDLLPPEPFK